MTIRKVGPNSTYSTIDAAVAAAAAGDTIRLESGYSYKRAVLTVQDLIVQGDASSVYIDLKLGAGINDVTLLGRAPIEVFDNRGSNTITGNRGHNTLHVSGGADVVVGGAGRDHLVIDYFDATTSVIGTMTGVTDGGTRSVSFDSSVEDLTIFTGSGDDSLTVGDGNNEIRSGGGDDTITAGDGHNEIYAPAGNATIRVGDGRNWIGVDGDSTVTTGNGSNTVSLGNGNSTVTTGAGRDTILAGDGEHTLVSGAGDDLVHVSDGNHTVDAGVGSDRLEVNYAYWDSNVTVRLSGGNLAHGYSGVVEDDAGHSVTFAGVEHFSISTGDLDDYLRTGPGNDVLSGGSGDDTLYGGRGEDELSGGLGNDLLVGGADYDEIYGGGGDDTLIGSLGSDRLFGDEGADTFIFRDPDFRVRWSGDTIVFLDGTDTIDLSRIDADVTKAGDQAFVFVDNFSGKAGEATFKFEEPLIGGNVTTLALDTNGDKVVDIFIGVAGYGSYSDFDNFIL